MSTSELLPPESCKVYTPRPIADVLVQALGTDRYASWLEPCVGTGVFLSALASAGVARKRIIAVDLDPVACEPDSLGTTFRGVDFLSWSEPIRRQFDRITGNPPYVPLSRLDPRLRKSALAVRIPGGDSSVSPTSNVWFAFLCRCLHLLRPGGNLGLVLPAAWDFADYASGLRKHTPLLFREFITFRSRRPLFDEVQDGSVIIIGRGFQREHRHSRRVECRDRKDLVASIRSICTLGGSGTAATLAERNGNDTGVPLGQFLEIRLGGVTGQADYFLLSEEQRCIRGLPEESVTPVISRSRHLTGAAIDRSSWQGLLRKGERVWLFNPTDELTSHPSVARYLSLLNQDGGCDRERYKIKNRTPWFRTPLPARVDGFMSGMTRTGPWLALRTMRNLNATNTLYVVRFKEKTGYASKCALSLSLLTSSFREQLRESCRHYADGLMKYEPGDLLSLNLLPPPVRRTQDAPALYQRAVKCLLAGKDREAFAVADSFFLG
jgi:adenine-specific DNA-methyltransferase